MPVRRSESDKPIRSYRLYRVRVVAQFLVSSARLSRPLGSWQALAYADERDRPFVND